MAKALTNIQYGDADGNVRLITAGHDVPDDVLQSLKGCDWATDEPAEDILESAGEDDTIEISPGVTAPNPKSMSEEEADEFDEDGFREAVESIRNRPLGANSGEPSYGRIPGSETDNGFLTSSDQRALNLKHREVVKKVVQAEEDRMPVGSAVAGQNPRPRAARISPAPGFKLPAKGTAGNSRSAAQRAGTGRPGGKESEIEKQQRQLRERQEADKDKS